MINKFDVKLLFDLVVFLILCSDIPLDFHNPIRALPLEYLIYFYLIFLYVNPVAKFIYQIFC